MDFNVVENMLLLSGKLEEWRRVKEKEPPSKKTPSKRKRRKKDVHKTNFQKRRKGR